MSFNRKIFLAVTVLATMFVLSITAFAQDDVTIKWFMRWDQNRVDNVAIPVAEAFTEATGINIEFENIGTGTDYYIKLQTTVAGGTAPDVFFPATHVAYNYASKGAMLSISDYVERDGIDLSLFDPTILELYTIDDELYCLPLDNAALVVFYNKELFDAAGVDYPADDWTWDDFLATAQALTLDTDDDGVIDQFGVDTFRNYWPMVVWSDTGQGLFDDIRNPTEFLGNSPEAVESVQFIADLILEHGVMPSDEQRADISDLFAASKSAMQIVGHWRMQRYLGSGFDFDFASLPLGDSGQAVNRADGSCFAISASTEHPDEAWELVKFLAGPESTGVDMLLDLGVMTPALSDYRSDPRFIDPEALPGVNKDAFLAGEGNYFSMYDPIHPMYSAFDALWKQELGEVWIGNVSAEEAMARIADEVSFMLENIQDYE
ncbi:MAG: ABC transporter substrate-binding protein [Aggregatilineales bacterium]